MGVPLGECPVAAVTKDHKCRGLKPSRCIPLQFWRSEVRHQFPGTKVKVWAGLAPSGGSRGESVSCPFPASGSAHVFWLRASQPSSLCFRPHISSLTLAFLPPSPKVPCDDTGPPGESRTVSPSQILSFSTSAGSLRLWKMTYTFQELGQGHLWGPLFGQPHFS